jgi:hypothetical protein
MGEIGVVEGGHSRTFCKNLLAIMKNGKIYKNSAAW